MPQRIAKRTTGKVSVWDVHVPVKGGKVDFTGVPYGTKLRKWLGWMLSEGKSTDVDPNLTYVDSLKGLLAVFQKHNEMKKGSTFFDGVPMLHYLKFSLQKKGGQHFFCFSTQFDDPNTKEQEYIDDMYKDYGALMEVVWRHCVGVADLLEKGPSDADVNDPPPPGQLPKPGINLQSYALASSFLDNVVDPGNVDIDGTLCFYNSNRDVSSDDVKNWQADAQTLIDAKTFVKAARQAAKPPGADIPGIFADLMTNLGNLGI